LGVDSITLLDKNQPVKGL